MRLELWSHYCLLVLCYSKSNAYYTYIFSKEETISILILSLSFISANEDVSTGNKLALIENFIWISEVTALIHKCLFCFWLHNWIISKNGVIMQEHLLNYKKYICPLISFFLQIQCSHLLIYYLLTSDRKTILWWIQTPTYTKARNENTSRTYVELQQHFINLHHRRGDTPVC